MQLERNKTQRSRYKIPKPEVKKTPEYINHIKTEHMIANGAEGRLEMPDGTVSAITVTGKGGKKNNEDGIYVDTNNIAVADGMGGEAKGDLAAYWTLVSAIKGRYENTPIKKIPAEACQNLQNEGLPKKSGSTLALARKKMKEDGTVDIEVCTVGDAKILVISKSKKSIAYESKDQSAVQRWIDGSMLEDPIERYQNEYINLITNSISTDGLSEDPRSTILNRPVGDSIIIACSDGISDFVTPEEILDLVLQYQNLCADEILNLALSRQDKEEFEITLDGKKRSIDQCHGDNTSIAVMMA